MEPPDTSPTRTEAEADPPPSDPGQPGSRCAALHGLDEVIAEARHTRLLAVFLPPPAGERDEPDAGPPPGRPQVPAGRPAVEPEKPHNPEEPEKPDVRADHDLPEGLPDLRKEPNRA